MNVCCLYLSTSNWILKPDIDYFSFAYYKVTSKLWQLNWYGNGVADWIESEIESFQTG